MQLDRAQNSDVSWANLYPLSASKQQNLSTFRSNGLSDKANVSEEYFPKVILSGFWSQSACGEPTSKMGENTIIELFWPTKLSKPLQKGMFYLNLQRVVPNLRYYIADSILYPHITFLWSFKNIGNVFLAPKLVLIIVLGLDFTMMVILVAKCSYVNSNKFKG